MARLALALLALTFSACAPELPVTAECKAGKLLVRSGFALDCEYAARAAALAEASMASAGVSAEEFAWLQQTPIYVWDADRLDEIVGIEPGPGKFVYGAYYHWGYGIELSRDMRGLVHELFHAREGLLSAGDHRNWDTLGYNAAADTYSAAVLTTQ